MQSVIFASSRLRVSTHSALALSGHPASISLAPAPNAPRLARPGRLRSIAGSGVRVRWTTNEFTRGTVAYGAQAGAYTESASETYFERQHEEVLPPVAPGAQLHFQIVAVDLSGNQAATGDQMVAGQSHVYLPLVRRR